MKEVPKTGKMQTKYLLQTKRKKLSRQLLMKIYGTRITRGIFNKHLYNSDEISMRQHGTLRNWSHWTTVLYKRIKDLMVIREELKREAFQMSCLLHLNIGNALALCYTADLKAKQGPVNNITRHWIWNCLLKKKNC